MRVGSNATGHFGLRNLREDKQQERVQTGGEARIEGRTDDNLHAMSEQHATSSEDICLLSSLGEDGINLSQDRYAILAAPETTSLTICLSAGYVACPQAVSKHSQPTSPSMSATKSFQTGQ